MLVALPRKSRCRISHQSWSRSETTAPAFVLMAKGINPGNVATVTISPVLAEDVLAFSNTAAITGVYAAGTLTLTGSDTVANYQAALRTVTYNDTNVRNTTATTRTVSITVNDGTSSSNTVA